MTDLEFRGGLGSQHTQCWFHYSESRGCGPQTVLQGDGGEIRDGTLDISSVDLFRGQKKKENWKV